MTWKGLIVLTGTENPIVVILSGSMKPAFHRGDILFLTKKQEEPLHVGDIVVFKVKSREIPIVHRIVRLHKEKNGTVKFLTKGDNNAFDDMKLYNSGQYWLRKENILGKVKGYLPYFGLATIILTDYPVVKYILFGVSGITALLRRE